MPENPIRLRITLGCDTFSTRVSDVESGRWIDGVTAVTWKVDVHAGNRSVRCILELDPAQVEFCGTVSVPAKGSE